MFGPFGLTCLLARIKAISSIISQVKQALLIIASFMAFTGGVIWWGTRPGPTQFAGANISTPTPTPNPHALSCEVAQANNNATELIALTNQERAKAGLPQLVEDARLDKAASLKAQDMITNHYWAHVSPTGVQPWYWFNVVGYKYLYAGENLADEYTTTDEAMRGWMNSPGHKANILNVHYIDIGMAVTCGVVKTTSNSLIVAEYGS
jgi:uncharacterized protein YkwD